MHDVLALILGGGRGARLFPLTRERSEPAVPFAGKYRLIDVPISNCINSGVLRVYVLTQYASVSLHRHIAQTYKLGQFSRGFIEVLAAQQTYEGSAWYRGTADAVRQHLRHVQDDPCNDVLLLYGDQLYRIDFHQVLATHRQTGADITMAVVPVTAEAARHYGIVRLDAAQRIVQLVEKPSSAEQLAALHLTPEQQRAFALPDGNRAYLANSGMYLIKRSVFLELLNEQPDATDLLMQVVVPSLAQRRIQAHLFRGYWQDVGSIRSYFEANLALASDQPPFDFHSPEGVIYTRMRYLPASRVLASDVGQCLVSDGCIVEHGARLERCVLGVRCHIGKNARLRDVVLMGANYYDAEAGERGWTSSNGPALGVGEGAVIERAILDKNVRIGKNVRIVNAQQVQHADGPQHFIRDGIVVIPNGAVVPDGAVI